MEDETWEGPAVKIDEDDFGVLRDVDRTIVKEMSVRLSVVLLMR